MSPELAAELNGYVKNGDPIPADRASAIRDESGDEASARFEKVRSAVVNFDKADRAVKTLDQIGSGLKRLGL